MYHKFTAVLFCTLRALSVVQETSFCEACSSSVHVRNGIKTPRTRVRLGVSQPSALRASGCDTPVSHSYSCLIPFLKICLSPEATRSLRCSWSRTTEASCCHGGETNFWQQTVQSGSLPGRPLHLHTIVDLLQVHWRRRVHAKVGFFGMLNFGLKTKGKWGYVDRQTVSGGCGKPG